VDTAGRNAQAIGPRDHPIQIRHKLTTTSANRQRQMSAAPALVIAPIGPIRGDRSAQWVYGFKSPQLHPAAGTATLAARGHLPMRIPSVALVLSVAGSVRCGSRSGHPDQLMRGWSRSPSFVASPVRFALSALLRSVKLRGSPVDSRFIEPSESDRVLSNAGTATGMTPCSLTENAFRAACSRASHCSR